MHTFFHLVIHYFILFFFFLKAAVTSLSTIALISSYLHSYYTINTYLFTHITLWKRHASKKRQL